MAGNKFSVKTEILKNSAKLIGDKVSKYNSEVEKLYGEIANLLVEWKGQSSDAFNKTIESYRPDFVEVEKILAAYSSSLIKSAEIYEKAEKGLQEVAKNLNKLR